jgi:hypothetical protein
MSVYLWHKANRESRIARSICGKRASLIRVPQTQSTFISANDETFPLAQCASAIQIAQWLSSIRRLATLPDLLKDQILNQGKK